MMPTVRASLRRPIDRVKETVCKRLRQAAGIVESGRPAPEAVREAALALRCGPVPWSAAA